jgi:Leucine-rich repeat (LRR) protein
MSRTVADLAFAASPILRGARFLVAAAFWLAAGWSCHADPPVQLCHGTVAVWQTPTHCQIIEITGPIGPDARLPPIEHNRPTFVSVRGVPRGMAEVCRLAPMVQITGLVVRGVNFADCELCSVLEKCPQLVVLRLRSPAIMQHDEFADLATTNYANVSACISDKVVAAIVGLKQLQTLELEGFKLTRSQIKGLAAVRALRHLALCDTPLADADLAGLQPLAQLEALDLSGTRVTELGLRLMCCRNLRAAYLDRTHVSDRFADELERGGWGQRLDELRVAGCSISADSLKALHKTRPQLQISTRNRIIPKPRGVSDAQTIRSYRAACELLYETSIVTFTSDGSAIVTAVVDPTLERALGEWVLTRLAMIDSLEEITLSGCQVSAKSLAELGKLKGLRTLDLSKSTLDDSALKGLLTLDRLIYCDLSDTRITDSGVAGLSSLVDLECLNLSRTQVSDQRIQALGSLVHLRDLRVDDCDLTNLAAERLSRFSSLEGVSLNGTKVTDEGVCSLASLPFLRNLSLNSCKVSDAGIQSLVHAKHLEGIAVDTTRVSEPLLTALTCKMCETRARAHPDQDIMIDFLTQYFVERQRGTVSSALELPLDGSMITSPRVDLWSPK